MNENGDDKKRIIAFGVQIENTLANEWWQRLEQRDKLQHEGYTLLRKTENWLSFSIFFLSFLVITLTSLTFIFHIVCHWMSWMLSWLPCVSFSCEPLQKHSVFGAFFATEAGSGAGYLLLALFAPAAWIAAGNFMHRRGGQGLKRLFGLQKDEIGNGT